MNTKTLTIPFNIEEEVRKQFQCDCGCGEVKANTYPEDISKWIEDNKHKLSVLRKQV